MSQLKTSLDHLPLRYRRELDRAVKILFDAFERATAHKTSRKKLDGKILKIILFGSFARGGWVDDIRSGYKSDYDLLIIVNSDYMTDFLEYWDQAEDRLMHDLQIEREVNFIVHSIKDVNEKLSEGQYFFSDIKKEGISLYELKGGTRLTEAKPLTLERHLEVSRDYFEHWFPKIEAALSGARFFHGEGNRNDAAFMLHQAVERAYNCVLLTFTHYVPAIHNIGRLRSLAEQHDDRLIAAWPREQGLPLVTKYRANFELLKKAYVEARYSRHYTITDEQLAWLAEQVAVLKESVEAACQKHLRDLVV